MTYQEKYEAAMLLLERVQAVNGYVDIHEGMEELRAAPVTETPTQIATAAGASMHRERYSL